MANWKALQAYGCKEPDFSPPSNTNPRGMVGGTWHANLHKGGTRYIRSSGGLRKRTSKASLRFGKIYKLGIFSPVTLLLEA